MNTTNGYNLALQRQLVDSKINDISDLKQKLEFSKIGSASDGMSVIQTRGNQTEVARMLSCARGTVLKYNRDSKGERHVIVNGVLMVKQGKRGRRWA